MAGTVRTTISVPRDLKARMEAEGKEINWSAVACRAFEYELAAIITMRKVRDMKDVINRLKASKAKDDSDVQAAGRAAGKEWASNKAEAAELERLDKFRQTIDRNNMTVQDYYGLDGSAYGPDEDFYFTIAPESDGDRTAAKDFWDAEVGEDRERTPSFVAAFADAALDLWDDVKDRI